MAKYEYQQNKTIQGIQRKKRQLPLHQTLHIAWQNIRVRLGRSLLVTSGIILALAFLTYIMSSDSLARNVAKNGSEDLLRVLDTKGVLDGLNDADAKIQTRWMVGLALLVSFVGILNAMLLSVTERYAEIGTMKCLGALDALIVELFFIESLFQGVLGTLAGIVIGLLLTLVEGQFRYGGAMWSLIPYGAFGRLLVICFIAGVVLTIGGALYPGYRAAKMHPVEAMRAQV